MQKMTEETVELVNKLATSDLFRWYGYRFASVENEAVEIVDGSGNQFVLNLYQGELSCWQSGKHTDDNSAKSKWIENVLNGASLECGAHE
jgi:hypothetical protein